MYKVHSLLYTVDGSRHAVMLDVAGQLGRAFP